LLPSPLQSNWRICVSHPRTGSRGVYFVSTAITSTLHALAARVLSEGLSMHVPQRANLHREPDGTIHLTLEPGTGTSADVHAILRPTSDRSLPQAWLHAFSDYRDFLAYCVPQDRALSSQPWYGQVTRQEISLGIPLEACEPLHGKVVSRTAQQIVGDGEPICFRVTKVNFRFTQEAHETT